MVENTLTTEIEIRTTSITSAERTIAITEMLTDNSTYTIDALAALRLMVIGEKAILAKLQRYHRHVVRRAPQ